ncbi:S-layer homology domain-containing protein [Candidatus Gracilibacteria bacterium]|nr:S-layer homology domain-containing protein [Candidatus Gracilibacteria bacterium]
MWKKFTALVAILSILATNVAFADNGGTPIDPPAGAPSNDAYLTNFSVAPITINPSIGENMDVSFDVLKDVSLNAYVVDGSLNFVETFTLGEAVTAGTSKSYKWHGTVNNASGGTAIADGKYTVVVYGTENGNVLAPASQEVTIESAVTPVNSLIPQVNFLKAVPQSFSAADADVTNISFDVSKDAYLAVVIKNTNNVTVRRFDDYKEEWYLSFESPQSLSWDGTNELGNEVADGKYKIEVTATNDDGTDVETYEVEIDTTVVVTTGILQNVKLSPRATWDPTDEFLEIHLDLETKVKSLRIDAKKGNKVIEILDDDYADDGDYEEEWDGTDDDGDYIREGTWEIIIRADGEKITKTIDVKYAKPNVLEAYVSKDSFDSDKEEFTNLIFKVSEAALITVDVYKGAKKEFTLIKDEEVRKNKWYSYTWDGYDEDGGEVNTGKDWRFQIVAENLTEDDVFGFKSVDVDIERDKVSDKKANVTNDSIFPAIFDDKVMSYANLYYCVDEEAELTVSIYEGETASGKTEAELLDKYEVDAGCNYLEWNGRDGDNKQLDDGVYTYKIQSKVGSHKDTETGLFVIGNTDTTLYFEEPPFIDEEPELPTVPEFEYTDCSDYYWDTKGVDYESCEAIAWATKWGIFSGYADGRFRPFQTINRAEVLKVILEAFGDGVSILPANGTSLGFADVEPLAWYMPYMRTAQIHGMLHGFGGTNDVRPYKDVNRVEFLKLAIEASDAFTGFDIPSYGYSYYADVNASNPDQNWFLDYAGVAYSYDLFDGAYLNGGAGVTRAEVATVLYKMSMNGLL